ncbi:unnamed protein product, partial [Urochloa humidicola]
SPRRKKSGAPEVSRSRRLPPPFPIAAHPPFASAAAQAAIDLQRASAHQLIPHRRSMDLGIPSSQTVDRAPHGRDGRSPENLRPKEKAAATPVVLRLFGVDVRHVAEEDGKGYASDDLELASRQQKCHRRKV